MDDQEIPEIIAPDKLEVKGPDNSSPPPSKPQPQKSETQKKRKSWLARLLRFFVLFGIACIVLLVAVVVALQYFSPYEKIRPQAEAKISELLGLPVSIGAVEFSPISGARVQDLVVGGEQPLLKIREAVLDYDLSELFQGKLVINQVLVDRPELTLISRDGVWNFQGILDRLQKKQDAPEPTAPTPPIAVAVDLKELLIKNIRLHIDQDEIHKVTLDGLSLSAMGKLDAQTTDIYLGVTLARPPIAETKHNIELWSSQDPGLEVKTLALSDLNFHTQDLNKVHFTGQLYLSNNHIDVGGALPNPDISGDFDLDIAIQEQFLQIHKLVLGVNREHGLELSGQVSEFLAHPNFDLLLKDAHFDIENGLALAKAWLPATDAKGKLTASGIHITGSLPNFKPGKVQVDSGNVNLKNFHATHAPAEVEVEGLNVGIKIQRLDLDQWIPKNLKANIQTTLSKGHGGVVTLKGFKQTLNVSAKGSNLPEAKLDFATNIQSIKLSTPEWEHLDLPFEMNGALQGNLDQGHVRTLAIDYASQPFIAGTLSGKAEDFGKKSFHIAQQLTLQFAEAESLIPPPLLEKLKGLSFSGSSVVQTSVDGRLDENFSPIEAQAKTDVNFQQMDFTLNEPAIDVRQMEATISFPVSYKAESGIKIPKLKIKTAFEKITALNNWMAESVRTETNVAMKKFYNFSAPSDSFPISQTTTVTVENVSASEPAVVVTGLNLNASTTGELRPDDFQNAVLEGRFSLNKIAALEKISTGPIKSVFTVHIDNSSLTHTQAQVKVDIEAPSFRQGDLILSPGAIKFSSRSRQNIQSGEFEIEQVRLSLPSLMNLEASGKVAGWGKSFDLQSNVTQIELAEIIKIIPEPLMEGFPGLELAGTAGLDLRAKGELPKEFSFDQPELPVELSARFAIDNGLINLPDKGIRAKTIDSSLHLDFKDQTIMVFGEGSLSVLDNRLGKDWWDPDFKFRYSLNDWNKLIIDQQSLSIGKLGFTHLLSGQVDGLKPFITKKVTASPQELTRRLDVALDTKNKIQIDEALQAELIALEPELTADGGFESQLKVTMVKGKQLEIAGGMVFDKFNADIPGSLKITNANGKFPFNKKLWLDKRFLPKKKETFIAARKGFFSQLRGFSQNRNIFQVDQVAWQSHLVNHIVLDLLLKNNQLMAEKFIFDVLGGSAAGNFFLTQSQDGPELNFSTEFANLDFGELLKIGKGNTIRNADIDGNMRLKFLANPGASGIITMDQISLQVAITRIGADTLDRLLRFIDPEESKPAIVDTRAKLELASPHKILISLENGNLNVEAWLKNKVLGDIIKAPELKRVPISGFKQFQKISEQLQSLTVLQEALKHLAAVGMEFDENQNIVLY